MPESTIIMTKSGNKIDSSLKKKAFAFLEKLAEDDTAPGLHIEPIKNSLDKRVRTGRVDQGYRAVLFKLTDGGSSTYVFHGIWAHDDAITMAGKVSLKVNPVTGIAEIRLVDVVAPTESYKQPSWSPPDEAAAPAPHGVVDAPSAAEPVTAPWFFPVPGESLVDDLGLPPEVAAHVSGLNSEDELLDYSSTLDSWQGQVLLNLATGMTVAEAKADLEIEPLTEPVGDTDADILKGIRHPAAKIQFAEIDGKDELKQVIEGGDFGAWRVFLHPQQRTLVERSYNGAARVTGGAGTGKTVVLLHRARHLGRSDPSSRIVLTTFTRNLADALTSDLSRLDPGLPVASALGKPGVFVSGVDALASAVIRSAGAEAAEDVAAVLGQGRLDITRRTQTDATWRRAIETAGGALPGELRSPAFFEAEYALVVLPERITTRDEYLVVRRPGRGVRLTRKHRIAVWAVIEAYRLASRMAGTIDYGEAAAIAATYLDRLASSSGAREADHVLVDEGQDLSPAHWRLLRALVAEGPNDLFIAEDGHQRIYGHRTVLSRYGIRTVGRSRRLTLNYRTTAETLEYAVSLLEGTEYHDLEDESDTTAQYRSARRGPKPTVRTFASVADELQFVAETITSWVADAQEDGITPETIAILVRDRYQRDRVVTGLGDLGVSVRGVDREAIRQGQPVVMTMHRAKGTEFSRAVLFGVGDSVSVIKSYAYSEADLKEAQARQRSLLYVAASRARDELVATSSG